MEELRVRRLFNEFQPTHYKLAIEIDKKNFVFKGDVTIFGKKVGENSYRLAFHQKDLAITTATILDREQNPVPIRSVTLDTENDEVHITCEQPLQSGEYTVLLHFQGAITKVMNGMYPCFFEHEDHHEHLIATQFESHHAREAFPCIDEPEAKATFDLKLITPRDETVIANTPAISQEVQGDSVITSFARTPTMSTYLVAFICGKLAYREAQTKDGVTVRVYATPSKIGYTTFALDFAVKCLEFYNDYFAIPYPLSKCDMIALPDFASGAMENWGCITYREQALLVDEANTSLPMKQYVAMVIAHELAHQWFGNLVTMRWWTDLWLNEGFASWIEYLAVNHLYPEWEMWTQFICHEQQEALKLDALKNTHPVEVIVRHPDEIRTIFDAISYNKGASIIHMLYAYLGEIPFRDGLRHYLTTHAYKNTDTIDLWRALEHVSGKPVTSFMAAWTSQEGFPLLDAQVTETTCKLKQQRFYVNPLEQQRKTDLWPIPLQVQGLPDVLHKKDQQLSYTSSDVLKFNKGQVGFYRVVYNHEHLEKLSRLVQTGSLPPLDRLGLISDIFESAKSGYIQTVYALQFLKHYAEEDNAAVWDVIAGALSSIRMVMDDESVRERLKPFVRTLIKKQLHRLGWESKPGESHLDSLLRLTILGLASAADEESVVREAYNRFNKAQKSEDITPDIRRIVYMTVSREGDEVIFDKLLKFYDMTASSEERVTLSAALTNFKSPELIQRALNLIMTSRVRLQDVGYWVAYSFMNRHAKYATWEWMKKNWKWLEDNLGTGLSFSRMPLYAARSCSDKTFLEPYKQFFTTVLSPSLDRSYQQGIEIIEYQSAWKERDLEPIKEFLKK